jgi:transposase-like protein
MAVSCPFCEADDVELISLFGSQLLLSQYRCKSCKSYFEGLREDPSEPKIEGEVSHGR